MKVSMKNDYSFLFNSLNKSTGAGQMSWLSDYSSIKSGAYGKLLKAYYRQDSESSADDKGSASDISKLVGKNGAAPELSEETKAYSKAATTADALQKSIRDIRSLPEDADDDKTYEALSSFVKSYNEAADAAGSTQDKSISNRLTSIRQATASAAKSLNAVGISVGSDGRLSIDKDRFAGADRSDIGKLFAEKGSYASSVNVSAEMIRSTANYDSARNSTYTAVGSYSSVVGSLWDSTT